MYQAQKDLEDVERAVAPQHLLHMAVASPTSRHCIKASLNCGQEQYAGARGDGAGVAAERGRAGQGWRRGRTSGAGDGDQVRKRRQSEAVGREGSTAHTKFRFTVDGII